VTDLKCVREADDSGSIRAYVDASADKAIGIAIGKDLTMRMFVTGATGYIGSAVTRELLEARHQVVGLARSDTAAAALTAAGADVHRGALDDLDSLRAGAANADGVIHLAFNNVSETTDFAASLQADLRAVETIGRTLEDSGKPFVVTSGTLMLASLGRLATEADVADPALPRVASENATIALAERGARSSVIRLAPSVHGEGDKAGFVASLIRIARAKGVSAFVGDGSNRWPAVHRLDAARLFRLAAEAAPAGSRLNGAGEEGVPFREIAAAIARQLKLPVVGIAPEEAGDHFGFLSAFVSLDNPTSSALTQERLGWRPEGPTLIQDIEQGHYFTVEQGHYSAV
jgi:nucleoside-diphosphate-sugar epimerase